MAAERTERTNSDGGSLYQRMIEAAVDLANNPNRSSKFQTVTKEMTDEAMAAIRKRVESSNTEKTP